MQHKKTSAISDALLICGVVLFLAWQPTVSAAVPWKNAPLPGASETMLAYKYMPEVFSDQNLEQRLRSQIAFDQSYYRYAELTAGSGQLANRQPPLFSKAEVDGRNVDFLVPELMSAYKSKLAAMAAKVPDRYSVLVFANKPQYDQSRGVLYVQFGGTDYLINPQPMAGPGVKQVGYNTWQATDSFVYTMGTFSQINAGLAQRLEAAFGGKYIDPNIQYQENVPSSMTRSGGGGQIAQGGIFLALDRRPQIPAYKMSVADAERMLTRPQPKQPQRPTGQMSVEQFQAYQKQMQKLQEDNQKEMLRYMGAFPLLFEIEFTGARMVENRLYLDARLLEGTLFGTRGETLASYSAADFVSASAAYASLQQAEQQKQAEAAAVKTEATLAEDARLGALEILGAKLGMSVDRARSTVAGQMEVNAVYRMSDLKTQRSRGDKRAPNPYDEGMVLIGDGGKNIVTLYENNGRVVGITRRTSGVNVPDDRLGNALVSKFGKTDVDWGSSQWIWGDLGERRGCLAQAQQEIEDVQLDMIAGAEPPAPPWVGVGRDGAPMQSKNRTVVGMEIYQVYAAANRDSLAKCGPMMRVTRYAPPSHPEATVDFILYDHSLVADKVQAMQAALEAEKEESAADIKL
ncbi:MAG: hypothetical protein QNJ73_10065 [Gammaproteobacteria bacterium]|nr:hypothetical protein [Gammaproteobacteria bacterium]